MKMNSKMPGPKTMYVLQEGCPANALATNRDATQVVIAGRNVFKIFSIEEDEFVEKVNLRVGKNMNLNYSCADVVWNPVEDNILATAATNGAVVTWNLDKISRSKQDMVFQQHKRTANKVSFHPTEAHLLISGSQDGTMKIFDMRKKEVTSTFYSNSESVRDVQFNPHQYHYFAAVQENGNVQIWDLRKTDRYERQFTAHSGPVFACDWHPEDKRWLATAGRDKTIKVWDLGSRPAPDSFCTIQTIASVARIRWRPQRKYHIASSALVVDFSVNIWDIRRPYIPFAAFNEHKDVTTGIVWRNSPHVFLSTSKDSMLYQHAFADADRPVERANPMALDINCRGDIMLASSEKIMNESATGGGGVGNKQLNASSKLHNFFRKQPSLSDQFPAAVSVCMVLQNKNEKNLSMEWLVESAKRYRLTGRPFTDMCDHNAAVATDLNRHLVAQTWSMLKLLFTNSVTGNSSSDVRPVDEKALDPSLILDGTAGEHQTSVRHHSGGGEGGRGVHNRHLSGGDHTLERQPGDTSAGLSDEDTETENDTDHERKLAQRASGLLVDTQPCDFFFGDGDFEQMIPLDFDSQTMNAVDLMEDWTLPNEAFQPRHEIESHSPPAEQLCISSTTFSPSALPVTHAATTSSTQSHRHLPLKSGVTNSVAEHALLSTVKMDPFPIWECTSIVVDMLHHYAAQGDVQMSVSVLIVLGDRFKGVIDEVTQEQWYTSYIDLLTHFQLWTVANDIIKLSPLPSVNTMNHQSTTVYTNCNRCLRPLQRVGWLCDRCKTFSSTCIICHRVVKGLYVWCQGCCHGGHLHHVREWMMTNPWCPTGCGHKCEYT